MYTGRGLVSLSLVQLNAFETQQINYSVLVCIIPARDADISGHQAHRMALPKLGNLRQMSLILF